MRDAVRCQNEYCGATVSQTLAGFNYGACPYCGGPVSGQGVSDDA